MLRSPPSAATSMDSEAKMDLLANIPSWGDIERNLEQKFSELNQSVDSARTAPMRPGTVSAGE